MGLPLAALALLPAASPLASLDVSFTGLRSAKGVLQICLTARPAAFPDCRDGMGAIRRTVPAAAPHLRIDALPPGDYALAVIHDANGNARLDTTLGIPREGFGFSRNPRIGFGPPRFSAASFGVRHAEVQQVRIRYLL